MFDFGFGSKKEKTSSTSTTSIDDWLRRRQEANYAGAQNLAGAYSPTSAGQIAAQMNPFTRQVVDRMYATAGEGRRQALNQVADRASAAGAFGGSRHGVAEGVAVGEFDNALADRAAGLLHSGFQEAANRAIEENRYGYAYPLERQGVLNASLAGITPTTTTNSSSTAKASEWGAKLAFGGGGGGGGGGSSGEEMDLILKLIGGG